MKISVITATYNSAATVQDTLRCIQQQDHPDIEHIIVDGRSTDNTLAIAAGFPHVAKIVSEKDKGIYDAMNKGIRLATGDVIGILNSDDVYIDAGVLSGVARAFADPAVMTVYADLQYVHPGDLDKVIRTWIDGPFPKRRISTMGGCRPIPPSLCERKYMSAPVFSIPTCVRRPTMS